jgi:predicted PurR-regulated permease PerM
MRFSWLRKLNTVLLLVLAVLALMVIGRGVLVPLGFAVLLSFLLAPVAERLERWGLHRLLSTTLCTLVTFVFTVGTAGFLVAQLQVFVDDLPAMQQRAIAMMVGLRGSLSNVGWISPEDAGRIGQEISTELLDLLQVWIKTLLGGLLNTTVQFLLVLVYLFLLLLKRGKYHAFILDYTPQQHQPTAREVMERSSRVAFLYLWGRLKVMAILGTAYFIAFTVFGVPYVKLLVLIATIITVIPFVGAFLSGLLPIIIFAFSGAELNSVLMFMGVVVCIQLSESYILQPLIMGTAISLSPMAVILAVVVGGAIWGIAGMILLVPMVGVLKILFDHIPGLEPTGTLIGTEPSSGPGWFARLRERLRH